jgi:secondary thiamine-phosphate synthase enzyme
VVKTEVLNISTKGNTDIIDVTGDVAVFLRGSGLKNGIVNVFVPGATGGVTTIEFESGLVKDFKELMEKLAPEGREYAHNLKWGDGNGHSHLRASLVGPSLTVPVKDGAMILGTWQQIIVVDFDNRPRRRGVVLQAIGE